MAPAADAHLVHALAGDLQHHAAAHHAAQRALGLVGRRDGRRPRSVEPPRRVEGLDGVVGDEGRDQHQVGVEARRDPAVEQQLLDRAVALDAGVDDAVADAGGGAGVEPRLEAGAERRLARHLHREHQRVAEDDDATLARRLGPDVGVAHALRVGRDRRRELGGREHHRLTRPQPVADDVVGHEELLEDRRRLAAALPAQEPLEGGELGDQHERGHEQSAHQRPPGSSAHPAESSTVGLAAALSACRPVETRRRDAVRVFLRRSQRQRERRRSRRVRPHAERPNERRRKTRTASNRASSHDDRPETEPWPQRSR